MQLGDSVRALLGNHDLHLLATAHGVRPPSRATRCRHPAGERPQAMLDWLRQQPLARRLRMAARICCWCTPACCRSGRSI
jgi:bis(5'-nucleosyl)-tetraphosphatase (symmetrical)